GLILRICEGLRPPILPNMPDDCAQMMQKCWDADPSKRPTIGELLYFAYNKFEKIHKNGDLETDSNNNSNIDNDGSSSNSPQQQIHKKHPLAYRKSRILD